MPAVRDKLMWRRLALFDGQSELEASEFKSIQPVSHLLLNERPGNL